MKSIKRAFMVIILLSLLLSACGLQPEISSEIKPTDAPAAAGSEADTISGGSAAENFSTETVTLLEMVSEESLLGFLEELTSIQPYSGWRNSASSGEAEALDYAAGMLGEYDFLQELGLELERQEFHVFMGTELWETKLELTVGGKEMEVPADGLRGHRDETNLAIRFDSDGKFNDSERDPVVVAGPIVLVDSEEDIYKLATADINDKIVFIDYSIIDRSLLGTNNAVGIAWELAAKNPAGIVMVTEYSSKKGVSHGTFIGDGSAFTWVETAANPPVLYTRLEDLADLGIKKWSDLKMIESARLTWDADVFSPATSGNLIAHVPGKDAEQAIIISAHIDSPNAPGAMDDGSGSAILIEIARILNEAQYQPPTDLYLVWYGSEELGLYGSQHFVSTHQELLDRITTMLQIDCLTRPLDGIRANHSFVTWSYGKFGNDGMPWLEYLSSSGEKNGISSIIMNEYTPYSDNNPYAGYDVPNANLIYMNLPEMDQVGGVWPGGQIHNPYDTIELADEMGKEFVEMAKLALLTALQPPAKEIDLRFPKEPSQRAVIVASHTEASHLLPSNYTDLGMALAVNGYDVDLIPYGQSVTNNDLADADLVFAYPVLDYPNDTTGVDQYDTGWSIEEVESLKNYVMDGGLLVISNTANRMKYGIGTLDANEDILDMNALSEQFGITFLDKINNQSSADRQEEHPIMQDVYSVELSSGNGVLFEMDNGTVLAAAFNGDPIIGLVEAGDGEVVVLADHAILNNDWGSKRNTAFWESLARYAAGR